MMSTPNPKVSESSNWAGGSMEKWLICYFQESLGLEDRGLLLKFLQCYSYNSLDKFSFCSRKSY